LISGPPPEIPEEDLHCKGDLNKEIHDILFPPLSVLLATKITSDGVIVKGKSSAQENVVFIIGGKESGKCVTGDTLVITSDGIIPIGRLYQTQEMESQVEMCKTIETFNFENFYPSQTSHIYQKKNTGILIVSNDLGIELKGTPHHRVIVLDRSGNMCWKPLSELKINDKLVVRSNSEMYAQSYQKIPPLEITSSHLRTPDIFDERMGYLFGILSGRGRLLKKFTKGIIEFHSPEKKLLNIVQNYFEEIYGFGGEFYEFTFTNYFRVICDTIYDHLIKLGLQSSSVFYHNIPSLILTSPKSVQTSYLRGYFDAVGRVSANPSEYELTIPVPSMSFAHDMQIMLLNMGILSKWITDPPKRSYLLILPSHYKLFSEIIGSNHSSKTTLLTQLLFATGDSHHSPLPPNCHVSPVISIEYDRADVYDFVVPDTHSFVANGLINHNTDSANSIIREALNVWGEENVHILASKNFHAMVGHYDETSPEKFIGSKFCSKKPIHIIVHDDALTHLSVNTKSKVIDEWQKVFQNSRHLVKYRDENNNKRGYNLFITIFQDYYGLHPRIRNDFSLALYKTMPKNYGHWRLFSSMIPKLGSEILEGNSHKLRKKQIDQSFKSKHVVDMGYGDWGEYTSVYTADDFCSDESPYWVYDDGQSPQDSPPIEEAAYEIIEEGEVVKRELTRDDIQISHLKSEDFPIHLVKEAFEWGKHNVPETAKAYLRNSKKIWKAGYMYFTQSASPQMIIEDGEINLARKQSLTNSYLDGGYMAILETEVLGHWMERVLPKFISDIDWHLIAGQSKSDFKDQTALDNPLGVGLHGELKTRRNKETPIVDPSYIGKKKMKDNWVSLEGLQHILAGGKVILYQLEITRRQGRSKAFLHTYEVYLKKIRVSTRKELSNLHSDKSASAPKLDAHEIKQHVREIKQIYEGLKSQLEEVDLEL